MTKPNNIDPLTSLLDAYDEAMDIAANRLLMDREGYDSYVQEARAEAKVALELLMVQERLEAVTHIMSAKTEGLFDDGDLFIKRAPIEQACIDLVGYEAYKSIKESLPVADPSQLTPKEN